MTKGKGLGSVRRDRAFRRYTFGAFKLAYVYVCIVFGGGGVEMKLRNIKAKYVQE